MPNRPTGRKKFETLILMEARVIEDDENRTPPRRVRCGPVQKKQKAPVVRVEDDGNEAFVGVAQSKTTESTSRRKYVSNTIWAWRGVY